MLEEKSEITKEKKRLLFTAVKGIHILESG